MLLPGEWEQLKKRSDPKMVDGLYRFLYIAPELLANATFDSYCRICAGVPQWSGVKAEILDRLSKKYQSLLPPDGEENAQFRLIKTQVTDKGVIYTYRPRPGSCADQLLRLSVQLTRKELEFVATKHRIDTANGDTSLDDGHEAKMASLMQHVKKTPLSYLHTALNSCMLGLKKRPNEAQLEIIGEDGTPRERKEMAVFMPELDSSEQIAEAMVRNVQRMRAGPIQDTMLTYCRLLLENGYHPPEYAEMAAAMQVSEGTIKSRLNRGKTALRDLMRKEGINPEEMGYTKDTNTRAR